MGKDQTFGRIIFTVWMVLAVSYVAGMLFYDPYIESVINIGSGSAVRYVSYWLSAVPVLIAFVAVLTIGAWIGWTMATTPSPKPLEEIEIEETKEETKNNN